VRPDFVRTYYEPLDRADFGALVRIAGELSASARARLQDERASETRVELRHSLELRYAGQDFSMAVPVDRELLARGDRDAVKRAFNASHQQAFGYHDAEQALEIVNVRLAAVAKRPVAPHDVARELQPSVATVIRPVWFSARASVECRVYQREALTARERIEGPAIVQEYASTTLVGPRDCLDVTPTGELVITLGRPPYIS
jgi:N-methylhydantoinase A